jgi:hypothetical protein
LLDGDAGIHIPPFGSVQQRPAVREFDGGLPRAEAERLAYADTVADLGEPPPGVKLSPPSAMVIAFDPGRRQGERG